MKNTFIISAFLLMAATTFSISEAKALFKVHADGQISFQSLSTSDGVQILPDGKTIFNPNETTSSTILNQTNVHTQLVRAWNVKYVGTNPGLTPVNRFYVTGIGNVYSNGQYIIQPEGHQKRSHLIENASTILSNLNGYYYDNHDFEGFEPDFIDNPNIAPEAVEGMLKDLAIDKSLGLSAEDLEVVLPEAIRHDPEGMVYINYSAVIPVLVEAFKEQQARIEQLEAILKDNGLMKP